METEKRYSLATGGGIARPHVQPRHARLTADEVRAWARDPRTTDTLDDFDRRLLAGCVELALAKGGGAGGAGCFSRGVARGMDVVSFELRVVQ